MAKKDRWYSYISYLQTDVWHYNKMLYRPQTVQTTNFEDAKWLYAKFPESTYIPRVPQCLSPRPNWDPPPPPTPLPQASVSLQRNQTPSPADEGVGSLSSDDRRKRHRTLSTLWSRRTMSAKNSLLQNVEPQNDRNTNYLPLNVLDAKLSGGNFARITS